MEEDRTSYASREFNCSWFIAPVIDYTREDIVRLRKSLKLSRKGFAKLTGFSYETIRRVEEGKCMAPNALLRMCEIVEMDPQYFIDNGFMEPDPNPPKLGRKHKEE